MPAGRGKLCETCYWQGLLNKRTAINCASFTSELMAEHFNDFAIWLGNRVSSHKAAITINRYVPFFKAIENEFNTIPDYHALLVHFGAEKLRKVLLPMRWLEDIGRIVVDTIAREENSEKRRIQALLNKVGTNDIKRQLLNGYHHSLMQDSESGKTTLRSIRLALSPALSLLTLGESMKLMPPNQKVLDAYLQKSAGQRAAVSGFVNYLRDTQGVTIQIPKLDAGKAQLNRKKKLEAEMLALMKQAHRDELNREWLSVALAYFHGLPKKVGKTVPPENIIHTGDGGITVSWNGLRYWIQL